MITVSYHAKQQMQRLSPVERRELQDILQSGDLDHPATDRDDSGRFVSKLGKDKRVVWSKDGDDNVTVLTVVTR